MGFFKKILGDAVDEMKKNIEDSKNEMLKRLSEALDNSENEEERLSEAGREALDNSENEENTGKKIWWVNRLSVLYDGNKYALKYLGDPRQKTKYIYDDVDILNEYQVRLAQKQADASYLYGVASTCGWKFVIANCEYTKVTFLDGEGAVLAIDEDGDEFAIDRWGDINSIEAYRAYVEKKLKEDNDNDNDFSD